MVERHTAQAVQEAITNLIEPHRVHVHMLTADNGKEFANHHASENLSADFFFAHP
jgi:IS30 family transposase